MRQLRTLLSKLFELFFEPRKVDFDGVSIIHGGLLSFSDFDCGFCLHCVDHSKTSRINARKNGRRVKLVIDLVPEGGPEAIGRPVFWRNVNGEVANANVVAVLPFCRSYGIAGADIVPSVRLALLFSEVIHFDLVEDMAAVQHKNGVWWDVLARKQALSGGWKLHRLIEPHVAIVKWITFGKIGH